jgi:uncharacterized protein YbdZ (MbtH family)
MQAAASLLVLVLVAGCSGFLPDRSRETLVVDIEATGAFVLGLPVPVAEPGSTVEDWLACAVVPSGWTVRQADTERGAVLEVAGNGSGRLTSCSNRDGRDGIAEDYLDASWTTNFMTSITEANARPQTARLHSDSAGVGVVMAYEAHSKYCGRSAHFEGLLSMGWTEIPGRDEAVCS